MFSDTGQNCVVCGENQFEYVDGFHYCAICGAKCERFVDVDEVGEQNLEDVAAPSFALSKLRADVAKRPAVKRKKRKYDYDSDYDNLDSSSASVTTSEEAPGAVSTPKKKQRRMRSVPHDYAKPFLLPDVFTIVIRKHLDAFIEAIEKRDKSFYLPSIRDDSPRGEESAWYCSDWKSTLRNSVFTFWKLFLRKRGDAFATDFECEVDNELLLVRRAREVHARPVCRPLFAAINHSQRLILTAKRVRNAEQRLERQREMEQMEEQESDMEITQSDWTTAESEADTEHPASSKESSAIDRKVESLRPDVRNALRSQETVMNAAKRLRSLMLRKRAIVMNSEKPLTMVFLGALYCAPELSISEFVQFTQSAGIRYRNQAALLPTSAQLFQDDIRALTSLTEVTQEKLLRDAKEVAAFSRPEVSTYPTRSFDLLIIRILDQLKLPASFFFFITALKRRAENEVARGCRASNVPVRKTRRSYFGLRKPRRPGTKKRGRKPKPVVVDTDDNLARTCSLSSMLSLASDDAERGNKQHRVSLFDGQVFALAFVCVALKLAFGLDGCTEFQLSRVAREFPSVYRNFVFTDWAVNLHLRAHGKNSDAKNASNAGSSSNHRQKLGRVRSESSYNQRQFDRPETLQTFADQLSQLRQRLVSQDDRKSVAKQSQSEAELEVEAEADFRQSSIDWLLNNEELLSDQRDWRLKLVKTNAGDVVEFDEEKNSIASRTFNWLLDACCCLFSCTRESLEIAVNQVLTMCFSFALGDDPKLVTRKRAMDVALSQGFILDSDKTDDAQRTDVTSPMNVSDSY